jgi:nucleotide-binding universal stress UspA family protein
MKERASVGSPAVFSGPIVCGVDFSEHSSRALTRAGAVAHALGVRLVVLTALDPLLNEAAQSQYGPGTFVEGARRDLSTVVQTTLGQRAAGVAVDAIVGDAPKVLLDGASRAGASIVVVGTQGLGRAERLVFGSTTLRVMRSTDRPVLAVPPPSAATADEGGDALWFDRIVCGIDFSPASDTAARAAVALGQRVSVPVTLVHAAGRAAVPQAWHLFAASAADRQTHDADARLRELVLSLGEPAPAFEVVPGEAGAVIDERATSALIVLGLGGASHHRPGSTAMRILAATRTPVLTVPEELFRPAVEDIR